MTKFFLTIVFQLFLLTGILAQAGNAFQSDLAARIAIAPESVFKSFREEGMNPVNHELTATEKAKVEKAFALLSPLHQRVLKTNLQSISFMDDMPNTALTSPVESEDSVKMYNITFRAGILSETVSQWATKKENTLFDRSLYPEYSVNIDAGDMDALVYVLLHEATHVIDAVLNITPHPEQRKAIVTPTTYTANIWYKMNVPVNQYLDTLLEKTRFRSGKTVDIAMAPGVYGHLKQTPFPSLYAMAAWFEDIAEMEAIYHLTKKLNQPFQVVVKKDNTVVAIYEPMKNKLVKRRLKQLARFYKA
jgi:hypothetical protein